MGLVGDLNDPAPSLPTEVTSADGALRVSADPVWGGASLVVDFATKTTVNLYDNPSFETGVGRWSGFSGADAPVVSTTQAWTGDQSLYCARGAGTSAALASDSAIRDLLTGGAGDYVVVVRVWIPALITGPAGAMLSGSGVVGGANFQTTAVRDDWAELTFSFTWDGSGTVILYARETDITANAYIHLDGIHIVPGTTPPTDYFDGDTPDTPTDTYEWDGTPHASSSTHTAYPTTPHSIRIHRRTPDGQVVAVRGADPNLSPGGISPSYDHEAPLGVVCTWWAEALDRDGTVLTTSAEAALTIPQAAQSAWLKSLASPDLSAMVRIDTWDEQGRDSRATTYDIAGRASRAATLRTPARRTATLGIQTDTEADYHAVAALLDAGVLYLDATDDYGIGGPHYLVRTGDLPVERQENLPDWKLRHFLATVEIIDRPPTTGSPMRTPAASWETLTYSTYTEMGNANPSWLDLIDG